MDDQKKNSLHFSAMFEFIKSQKPKLILRFSFDLTVRPALKNHIEEFWNFPPFTPPGVSPVVDVQHPVQHSKDLPALKIPAADLSRTKYFKQQNKHLSFRNLFVTLTWAR